jgi:hypothetical protein
MDIYKVVVKESKANLKKTQDYRYKTQGKEFEKGVFSWYITGDFCRGLENQQWLLER